MTANEKAKFCLGQIVATPGAIEAMEASGQDAGFFLNQHAAGNWGIVDAEDRLLIHEYGHEYSGDHLSEQYHEALCRLGAKLKKLALEKPEALRQFVGKGE